MEVDTNIESSSENKIERNEKDENKTIIENLARDYSEYLEIDAKKEKDKFSDTVEDMLTKLDEFVGLADMIRGDTNFCLVTSLPQIQEKCKEMEKVFEKIDKLEAFVSVVRENLAVIEENVNKAEDEMGSFSGLKKMLSSFVSPKRSQSKDAKSASYTPPEIFRTEDYLPSKTTADDSEAKSETVQDETAETNGDNSQETSRESSQSDPSSSSGALQ